MVYNSMNGPTSRTSGNSATVGTQNELGTDTTSEYNQPNYGTGKAYTFIPIP
jgi:hypothetical protein